MQPQLIEVREVLGADTNEAATYGYIRFDLNPDNKVVLSIDTADADTLASAILTVNQMNDLVTAVHDILLIQLRNKR